MPKLAPYPAFATRHKHGRFAVSALRMALLSAVAVPSSAYAQAVWTNPGSGDWQIGANWSTGVAPSGFDSPIINNGGTAVISGTAASAGAVSVAAVPSSSGSLSILNGGTLTFSVPFSSVIGYGAGSVGTLTVDGAGSQLTAPAGNLFVGTSGQGTMTVSNGGSIQVQYLDLAGGNTGQGIINVTSNGSLIVDDATLGRGSGVATLNISGGGTATFGSQLALGYDFGSAATANVAGPGSTLSVGSLFKVGQGVNSTGTLNLSNGGTAVAGGGSGTIALGAGPGASGFLNIGAAPGNPAAAPGTVSAAAVSLSPTSAINFNHTDAGYVFAPQITGSGSIHVYSGTTILTGANTYTGGTAITGGVLSVSADANLGDPSGRLTLDGGTLENTAAFTSARNVVLGDNGGTLRTNASLALTGTIIGNGFLDKGGTGTLTLTGINSYTGGTLVAAGTLALAGAGQLDPGGSVSMVAGATFDIAAAAGDRTIGDLSGAGGSIINLGANRLSVGTSNSTVFGGTIQGSGGLTKQGSGELTLTGANTYTGETLVTGGTALAPSRLVVAGVNARIASPAADLTVGRFSGDNAALTIESGGSVSNTDGFIGNGFGAIGTATVRGAGSTWANSDFLYVGVSGTGSLTIEDGGTVSNNAAYLGFNLGSSGTAVVRGGGSTWTNTNNLLVGYFGTGSLTIEDGGTVSNTAAVIGSRSGSSGTATVTGVGSTWNNSAELYVGGLGTGSLTIADGGTVRNTTGLIGAAAGFSGAAMVSGVGSTWTNNGDLSVGRFGIGTLTIENSGAVSNFDGKIGDQIGSSGTVVVRGAGSTWTNNSSLSVGYEGTGNLTIEDGGRVSAGSGVIGGASGSSGTVTVTGTGSTWNNNSGLFVGYSGTGNLTIENGGTVSAADGWISNGMGSSGTATVRGAGSQWNNSNYLSVGHSGTGSLTIEDGGRVSSTVGMIGAFSGSSGAVTARGAGSQWTINNDLAVGSSGTGSLTIEDGGRVSNTFAAIGGGSGSSGTAMVRGAGSTWSNSSDLTVGRLGTGALTVADGGAVSAATTRLGELASGQGALILAGSAGARGLLTTGQILKGAGSATLTLDGGILQATTDQPDFLSNFAPGDVVIGPGGALIDSNGHNIGIAAALSGSGGLIKTGAGLLTLTGTSTLSGPSSVLAGQLAVNGSLANSAVTVANAATLSGTGTIGGLSALSGATIAPGNSIGTLNVAGNVAFAAGSTYAVEINAAGQADRLAATGSATLTGGTVQVLPDQGTGYVANVPYTIVTATGGVTGAFSGTTGGEFAFVTPTLGYRTNAVALTLVRKTVPPTPPTPTPVAFHSVAVTKNQYSTADGVEALGAGNRLYDTVLGASVAGARQAFTALSGEVHASAVSVAYEDDRLVREAILTRLRQPGSTTLPAFAQGSYSAAYAADLPGAPQQPVAVVPSFDPRRFALWGEGFGSWGQVRANGNAAGLDRSTGGFILGADAQLDQSFRLGVAGGFTRTSFDIDGRLSSGSNESVFGALYGSGRWGAINLRLGASYAAHDIDVSRTVIFPGFGDAADASYDGSTLQAFGELGYGVSLGSALIEPFVGASVLRLHTDSFQESGGAAALTGFGHTYELGTTTVGVRAEARLSDAVPLTLRGLLGWRRAYGDVEPAALLAFAGGASAFLVSGVPVDRNALAVEAGLDWQATQDISLGVAYSGQIGSHAQDHALKGNFTWRFDTR